MKSRYRRNCQYKFNWNKIALNLPNFLAKFVLKVYFSVFSLSYVCRTPKLKRNQKVLFLVCALCYFCEAVPSDLADEFDLSLKVIKRETQDTRQQVSRKHNNLQKYYPWNLNTSSPWSTWIIKLSFENMILIFTFRLIFSGVLGRMN